MLVRRTLTILLASAAVAAVASPLYGGVTATPNPVSCTGYPEPRIYLENQSWWEPQPGPPSHPGTGKVGHIHVGMCFPLYQRISGDTLHLDVTLKLHNMPAIPSKVRLTAYNDVTWHNGVTVPPCATADCEYRYSYDFPMTLVHYRGWREFAVYLNVGNTNGETQRNWQRFYLYIDRPLPEAPPGSASSVVQDVGGDSWYSSVPGGTTGQYARANMRRADVPWSEATGELVPVSGTWRPTVSFEARRNVVYIDPALHASPPDFGTVVYDRTTANTGYQTETLAIDTTALSDGLHRLLIGSGNVGTNGTNTGVLVVPFLVKNGC